MSTPAPVATDRDARRALGWVVDAGEPALAELVRVHGTGSAEDVRDHLDGLARVT